MLLEGIYTVGIQGWRLIGHDGSDSKRNLPFRDVLDMDKQDHDKMMGMERIDRELVQASMQSWAAQFLSFGLHSSYVLLVMNNAV